MPELYLSRLCLALRNRETQRLLGDCHAMHRLVMRGFPDVPESAARQALGVLYRVEERPVAGVAAVLVQSRAVPHWAFETDRVQVEGPRPMDGLLSRIVPGAQFRFRLRANPVRRVHELATQMMDERPDQARGGAPRRDYIEDAKWKGKRVELRREEDRLDWLTRRGKDAGFRLLTARLEPAGRDVPVARADPSPGMRGERPAADGRGRGERLSFGTALFEGVLEVEDPDRLREAIAAGIGPAKAFGCGLLSIAPVP
jgi:CRISPR system Cascade subunit CasE